MKKQVRETAAGRQIEAFVVLKGKREVAVVQIYHGRGNTRVDVFSYREGLTYQGSAGGYGYDRFTAALAGAEIGGVKIYNHCERTKACAAALKRQPCHKDREAHKRWYESITKRGMHAANYNSETDKFSDVYMTSGLRRLEDMGFQVIRAI